jgi:hypothetical protein
LKRIEAAESLDEAFKYELAVNGDDFTITNVKIHMT